MSSAQQDLFERLNQQRELLQGLDADMTVPLEACREFGLDLRMRGPARDISVFRFITDRRGIWEPHLSKLILSTLRPGDTFVDAGANLGYFTILGGSKVGPNGRVVALEPVQSHLEYCRNNIALNGLKNVDLLPYALWDSDSTMRMSPSGDHRNHMGGARLILEGNHSQLEPVEVRCVALDDLIDSGEIVIDPCQVLKIDIEGAEPFAFDGMSRFLARDRPMIVVELNSYCLGLFGLGVDSVWDRLRVLDYEIAAVPNEHQAKVFDNLRPPGDYPDLRTIESLDQLVEIVEKLNEQIPPCDPIDLAAIAAGAS